MKRPRFLKTDFKTSQRHRFHRRVLPLLMVLVLGLAGPLGIWLKSARVSDYKEARVEASRLAEALGKQNLDAVLGEEERQVAGLVEGAEKRIIWPPQPVQPTPFALISFHGFMATRQELSPVLEDVASELRVPLFFSRVAHHGIKGDDLGRLTLGNYIESIAEAEVVGAHLAPRLVVAGTSTGAAMAMMMAAQEPESAQTPLAQEELSVAAPFPRVNPVRALVLISPNFGLPRWDWRLATGPLGEWLSRLFVGSHYEWAPRNEDHAHFWTTKVSSHALRPMVEIVQLGMKAGESRRDWSEISVLVIQNPNDPVVDNRKALSYLEQFHFKRFELFLLPADNHVLAGRIVNPQNSAALTRKIVEFLSVE